MRSHWHELPGTLLNLHETATLEYLYKIQFLWNEFRNFRRRAFLFRNTA